jgi:purine-binding chemotaxis protein CheW
VLNLRGTIVPIIELRTKFGMPTIDYTMFTVIVVVVVREKIMGLVVDAVSDVLNIDKKDIQPPPEFGAKVDVSFLNGIGKSGEKLIALLDMDKLLSDDDLQEATTAVAA